MVGTSTRRLLVATLIAVTAAAGLSACDGDGNPSGPPPSPTGIADLKNSTHAADGGQLRVVETAFRPLKTYGTYTNLLEFTIIVENTSKVQKVWGNLLLKALDAQGRVVFSARSDFRHADWDGERISPIELLPGGRQGISRQLRTEEPAAQGREVVRLDVEAGPSDWTVPATGDGVTQLSDLRVTRVGPREVKAEFTATNRSGAEVLIEAVDLIFRDRRGRIVAGWSRKLAGNYGLSNFARGVSSRQLSVWGPDVSGADLDRTEIYLDLVELVQP
jgi:hypothetical protein